MIRKGRIPSTDIEILEKLCNKSDDTYTHHPNLEIKKSILKKAAVYEQENKKNNKKYVPSKTERSGTDGGGLFK